MLIFALTIFVSAFLLFQVQPMIAKIILPWFGGGAAVWSACLMFFQIVLLAGYLYSHATTKFLKAKQQATLHTALLIAAVCLLPIMPGAQWKPRDEKEPLLRILMLLCGTVGLPYLMLSTTGPLLQAWYTRASGGAVPYRLFALSNFGSFLALLSFPFLFEPMLTSVQQTDLWSIAFAVFAACAITAGWRMVKAIPGGEAAEAGPSDALPRPISLGRLALWVALAATASIMLIALSSHLTLNVAPMPFLWVLPLSIYLLTFILAFESDRVYSRGIFLPLLIVALGAASFLLTEENRDGFGPIYLWSAILFICCMVCHGELALQKPHPKQLTLFFLMVAAGGAFGGIFVAMIAPLWFNNYYELAISLGLCGVLAAGILWKERTEAWRQSQGWAVVALALVVILALWHHNQTNSQEFPSYRPFAMLIGFTFVAAVGVTWADFIKHTEAGFSWVTRLVWIGLTLACGARLAIPGEISDGLKEFCIFTSIAAVAGLLLTWKRGEDGRLDPACVAWSTGALALALCGHLGYYQHWHDTGYVLVKRNFYGGLKVRDQKGDEETTANRALVHGTINHGAQLLDPARRREVTSYYGPRSGFGRAMRVLQNSPSLRIGITGLGAGVTAGFCREGDFYRFFELNPMVLEIAKTSFSFLADCPGDKDVILGDGRLALERLDSFQFDLLAMDAFSSDSVPVHLLTHEAFGLYAKHLKQTGILAINVSNRYLNLVPVVTKNGHAQGMTVALIEDDGEGADFYSATSWMLCTRDKSFFEDPLFKDNKTTFPEDSAAIRKWTDGYSNLFQLVK